MCWRSYCPVSSFLLFPVVVVAAVATSMSLSTAVPRAATSKQTRNRARAGCVCFLAYVAGGLGLKAMEGDAWSSKDGSKVDHASNKRQGETGLQRTDVGCFECFGRQKTGLKQATQRIRGEARQEIECEAYGVEAEVCEVHERAGG